MPLPRELTESQLAAMRFGFIRRDPRLTAHQRLIVMEVLDHDFLVDGKRKEYAFPSLRGIARNLNFDLKTIRAAVHKARRMGYWDMVLFQKSEKGEPWDERWMFKIAYHQINGWCLGTGGMVPSLPGE